MTLLKQLPTLEEGYSRLYLCRHGQTDFNVEGRFQGRGVNSDLNATGQAQAKKLGEAMELAPLTAIYCSALKRARQTAANVAKHHSSIAQVPAYTELEEMSFGRVENELHTEFMKDQHRIWDLWDNGVSAAKFPEGESPLTVAARGCDKILELMNAHPPASHILMVTHGRFNKVILSQLLHANLLHMREIHQDNTCVNVLDFAVDSQVFQQVELNNTSHLNE